MRMMISWFFCASLPMIYALRTAGECYDICNSFKREILTLEMCREAKKLLPRPKIGDYCTRAMEDGFKDACFSLCRDERPVPRISQSCRAASMELPRPTVRKWCEHGYRQGYKATMDSLSNYFTQTTQSEAVVEPAPEPVIETQEPEVTTPPHTEPPLVIHSPTEPTQTADEPVNNLPILRTIPITLDEVVYDLHIYEGQSPEESVALFCQQHMTEDISGCIRQLLSIALEE